MKRLILLMLAMALLGFPRDALGALADTTEHGDRWLDHDLLLRPGQPCAFQTVILLVRGFEPTACDSFLGVSRVPGQPITIRSLTRPLADCPTGPVHFFAVPVELGQRAAGFHSVVVRRQLLMEYPNGSIDSVATDSSYTFTVVADCPPPPPLVWVTDLPLVDSVATVPARPCPDRPVNLELGGLFPDGCGRLESAWVRDAAYVALALAPYPAVRTACPLVLEPWRARFPLGAIEPGTHSVLIDQTVLGTNAFWPPIPDREHRGLFQFLVDTPCDTVSNPPLAHIRDIQIGPRDPGGPGPICPSDSIQVVISGDFPDDCCAIKRVELLPNPSMGPLPEPPFVRVVVDYDVNFGCPCRLTPEPWTGVAVLPPLASRNYGLIVELLEKGGGRDSTLTSTVVPFQVASAESCAADSVCLWSGWEHQGPYGSCDATVTNEHEGTVTLLVKPRVALAGLQGRLHSREPGLHITNIEPTGVAADMRLSWVREPDGARFVLYAEQGAPIPAGEAQRILSVRAVVKQIAGIPENPPPPPPGPVFHLGALELLGSDIDGNGVRECPPPPYVRMAPEVAVLCVEQPCDFNADGLNDVRDLVLLVRCALAAGPCPPDVATRFDCDGSGEFGVPDAVCCAMHMLRAPGCPTCPIDSIRVEPGIAVRFGAPSRTPGGVRVPLMIEGADRIGAAKLRLRFPADRFTAGVIGVGPSLHLQEVDGDVLTLGLIGGIPGPVYGSGIEDPGPLAVDLVVRPGRSLGGELQLLDGQFSGPDGVILDVDLDVPGAPLGEKGISLSAPRPNPFSSTTRFTVSLDSPASLDVAIHDISGRRLATVFRGNREAGLQEFSWNGRSDDGSEAPNGVFFLRVVVNEQVSKRKLILVRGRESSVPAQTSPVP